MIRALRYAVPIAIATCIVMLPWFALAFRAPWPRDLPGANLAIARAALIAGTGWIATFLLVAAIAPLLQGTLSQPRALVAALRNLCRMLLPVLAASAAVLVGGLALLAPALVLMVMFVLTGASTERGMPAPLVDSVAMVRAAWKPIAAIVAVMLVVDLALVLVAYKLVAVPFAKKLKPAEWATYGSVARVVVLGVAVTAPIFATLLATRASRRDGRRDEDLTARPTA